MREAASLWMPPPAFLLIRLAGCQPSRSAIHFATASVEWPVSVVP